MAANDQLVLVDQIDPLIRTFRGHKVLMDSDLAALYGVTTKRLNEQVRRNIERFPDDFMFQLSAEELAIWRSQIATTKSGMKMGLRHKPFAFTEHGAIMAASVLNSSRAVEVSVFVVRAFVKLRQWMAGQAELVEKLGELERRVTGHDEAIRQLVTAMRQLMAPPPAKPKRPIGFHATPADNPPTSRAKARRR
jgi:hypothetical protein